MTGELRVDLGAGNDNLKLIRNTAIKGIDINMTSPTSVAASDRDVVLVDGIRTDEQLNIRTGAGNDVVSVWDSVIGNNGSIYDNLDINTGKGRDDVAVFSSTRSMEVKGHIYINTYGGTETETDRVSLQSVIARRHISVGTGDGQDNISMTDVTTGSDILVSAGGGKDTVSLREVRALDDFWVYMGDGDDTLSVQYLNADELTLDGGGGIDSLSSTLPGQVNAYHPSGFEV